MRSLATDSPARSAQEPAMSEGMTRLLPHVESYGLFNFVGTEKCRTLSMGVRQFGRGLWGGEWGVWIVSTLWVSDWAVPVPDCPGFRMSRRESSVSGGLEPGSSPPRAQCFRRSGAFLLLFSCGQCPHSRL